MTVVYELVNPCTSGTWIRNNSVQSIRVTVSSVVMYPCSSDSITCVIIVSVYQYQYLWLTISDNGYIENTISKVLECSSRVHVTVSSVSQVTVIIPYNRVLDLHICNKYYNIINMINIIKLSHKSILIINLLVHLLCKLINVWIPLFRRVIDIKQEFHLILFTMIVW